MDDSSEQRLHGVFHVAVANGTVFYDVNVDDTRTKR